MTIKDIARISGYGVSTVSRALNGHPDVSEDAREKIRAIARENNFVPNANARQLKLSHNKTVVIIVKGTFNVFFSGLIENLQTEVSKTGASVLIHYINTNENEVSLAKRLSEQEKPLGIVFLGGNIMNFKESFEQISAPCVICTTSAGDSGFKNLSSVSVDDVDAGKCAIDYLIKKGHRNIGILGGDITTYCSTGLRYKGCIQSFTENGVSFDEDAFEYCEFSYQSAYDAAKSLLARKPELTAIFAMSDNMAIGAVRALHDTGKSVPDDISVIGYDGIEITGFYTPRITTFKQPETTLAAITVQLLQELIDGGEARQILLKSTFIEGGSVKDIN